jgi:hypothetical protein
LESVEADAVALSERGRAGFSGFRGGFGTGRADVGAPSSAVAAAVGRVGNGDTGVGAGAGMGDATATGEDTEEFCFPTGGDTGSWAAGDVTEVGG